MTSKPKLHKSEAIYNFMNNSDFFLLSIGTTKLIECWANDHLHPLLISNVDFGNNSLDQWPVFLNNNKKVNL